MDEKNIRKINDWLGLYDAPKNSWVKINGQTQLKYEYDKPNGEVSTLAVEGDYVCEYYYSGFLGSLTPTHIQKFLKETGSGRNLLRVIEECKKDA